MYSTVDLAIEKAGSKKALAQMLGVSRQAVESWKKTNRIPLKRVPEIAKKLSIDKRMLAPEFFG
ncbi:MAG: helix-turn-helix domain-containing protein [Exiguobacterium sp.]|nr:helix-turn-helix domain-containing protein [Exiguobacterium sp.]